MTTTVPTPVLDDIRSRADDEDAPRGAGFFCLYQAVVDYRGISARITARMRELAQAIEVDASQVALGYEPWSWAAPSRANTIDAEIHRRSGLVRTINDLTTALEVDGDVLWGEILALLKDGEWKIS